MGSNGATKFFAGLPAGIRGTERLAREDRILSAIESGRTMPLELRELRSEHAGHVAIIRAMRDSVQIGESGDAVRITMTPIGAQRAADALGLMLPTAKLVKLAWAQGYQISPTTGLHGSDMASTKKMIQHSKLVDQKLHGTANDLRRVVAANVGKHWVLSNVAVGKIAEGLPAFANYGWFKSPSNPLDLWQPLSTRHGTAHVDYSQIVWLVDPKCVVDGIETTIAKVAANPDLAPLVFEPVPFDHGTTLSTFRVPGVPLPSQSDPAMALDRRALEWCLIEAASYGSRPVDAARVRQYLEGCVRNGRRVGIVKGNFCSAAQGFAEHAVSLEGESLPPWRAAAKEHIADAKSRDDLAWHPVEEVLDGAWSPPPGAKAIYHRGDPGAWTGHIDRVIETLPAKNGEHATHYRNVGANELGGRWTIETSSFANPNLLGFVVGASNAPVESVDPIVPNDAIEPPFSEEDRAHIRWVQWQTCELALEELRAIREEEIKKALASDA